MENQKKKTKEKNIYFSKAHIKLIMSVCTVHKITNIYKMHDDVY